MKNVIHEINRNEWLILSAFQLKTVYSKIWVGFRLNTGKAVFLKGFTLNPTEEAQVLLKSDNRNF